MGNIVEIKHLNFSFGEKRVFDDFSLSIPAGSFTTIMGSSGSGKTTLARIMLRLVNAKSYVKINNMFINPKNIKEIRRKTSVLFCNPRNQFLSDTVRGDLVLALKNFGYSNSNIDKRIEAVTDLLNIKELLDINSNCLSAGQKQLIALAIALSHEPKLLIIDDGLTMIDAVMREKIFKILKEINKNGVTIINMTHDSEDLLQGSDVIIIGGGNLVLQEKTEKAFFNPKLFYDNKIDLPFVIDLSIKLQYYKVIDKTYLEMKKLVNALWT